MKSIFLPFVVGLLVVDHVAAKEPIFDAAGADRFFQTEVAPLLVNRCLECHDPSSREGGLDLARREHALAGGDSGEVLVAGKSDKSRLWQSVLSDEMPQDRDPLSKSEKATLKKWIDSGAAWTVDYLDPAVYGGIHQHDELWVRRLTISEYVETIRELFGIDVQELARQSLPPDARADGFRNTAYNLTVDLKHVQAYASIAEVIAERADVAKLGKRFHKGTKFIDKDMRALVESMGERIYRGPLRKDEIASLRGITTTVAAAGGDYEEAVR